jgi:hypothetical protein
MPERWDARAKRPGDFTGTKGAQLNAAYQAQLRLERAARQAAPEQTLDDDLAQAQALHPGARVYFDHELGDVVIDYTSAR